MLSDAIRATREYLAVHREPVTDGLLTTLQAYEVEARSLEFEVAAMRDQTSKQVTMAKENFTMELMRRIGKAPCNEQ